VTAPASLALLLAGHAAAALALAGLRAPVAGTALPDPFAQALAALFSWTALLALAAAALYALGLVWPALLLAASLAARRLAPAPPVAAALPLALVALIAAALSWLGLISALGGSDA
jgi:hypothetical protein